jgi:hypothetical protein
MTSSGSMVSIRRLLIPLLVLTACESTPPSRFHAVAPFSRTKATLGMKATDLREVQASVAAHPSGGLFEKIGEDEVIYEFGAEADSMVRDDARLNSISFARTTSSDMMTSTASWAAAVQEMRTAIGKPLHCGNVEYARATLVVAQWSSGSDEVLVTLLSDVQSNRLLHVLRQSADSLQFSREIDCP